MTRRLLHGNSTSQVTNDLRFAVPPSYNSASSICSSFHLREWDLVNYNERVSVLTIQYSHAHMTPSLIKTCIKEETGTELSGLVLHPPGWSGGWDQHIHKPSDAKLSITAMLVEIKTVLWKHQERKTGSSQLRENETVSWKVEMGPEIVQKFDISGKNVSVSLNQGLEVKGLRKEVEG